MGEAAPQEPEKKEEEKKKGFGKLDIIFIVVGVLVGLMYQSCRASGVRRGGEDFVGENRRKCDILYNVRPPSKCS